METGFNPGSKMSVLICNRHSQSDYNSVASMDLRWWLIMKTWTKLDGQTTKFKLDLYFK